MHVIPPMLFRLRLIAPLAISAFILTLLWLRVEGRYSPPTAAAWQRKPNPLLASEIHAWKRLGLADVFEYSRQCLTAKPAWGLCRSSVQHVPSPLFREGHERKTRVVNMSRGRLPSCENTIAIDVSRCSPQKQIDTSPLMLGVATTLKRLRESLPTFSRWLSNTGSPLLVLLVDQPDLSCIADDLNKLHSSAAEMAMSFHFAPYTGGANDTEGLKNFALVQAFHEKIEPQTQWFGIIDDDTFFISLPQAYQALEAYDSTSPWYIGTLTEGSARVKHEDQKAWGGAGFFISRPLMAILSSHSPECRRLDQGFGDTLWRNCIRASTSPVVPLTQLRGLHQMDMWGDVSGIYESGLVPLLTIHHWKSWHFHPVPNAHIVTDVTGPDSFLQRYRFTDDVVLTNGFSAVRYPNGLPDLDRVELTMIADVGGDHIADALEFHPSMGRTRPALVLGQDKLQWKFRHSFNDGEGTVRQFYVRPADSNTNGSLDSVVEIDWIRG